MKKEANERLLTVLAAGIAAAGLFSVFCTVFFPVAWLMTHFIPAMS